MKSTRVQNNIVLTSLSKRYINVYENKENIYCVHEHFPLAVKHLVFTIS